MYTLVALTNRALVFSAISASMLPSRLASITLFIDSAISWFCILHFNRGQLRVLQIFCKRMSDSFGSKYLTFWTIICSNLSLFPRSCLFSSIRELIVSSACCSCNEKVKQVSFVGCKKKVLGNNIWSFLSHLPECYRCCFRSWYSGLT